MTATKTMYDLAVAYRIYPGISRTAAALRLSKLDLTHGSLRSFRNALGDLRAYVWVALDGCPPEYESVVGKTLAGVDYEITRFDGAGNAATFLWQLDTLLRQDYAELVYLAEDDYLYEAGSLQVLVNGFRVWPDMEFASAYDHPDYYRIGLTRPRTRVRVADGQHWRTAGTTCLTFMARLPSLRRAKRVFQTYARRNYDASIWLSLTKHRVRNPFAVAKLLLGPGSLRIMILKSWLFGWAQILFGHVYSLWVPLPGLATHIDVHGMSPGMTLDGLTHGGESPEEPPRNESLRSKTPPHEGMHPARGEAVKKRRRT